MKILLVNPAIRPDSPKAIVNVGLAYVAMHKVYEYTVDVTGECKSSPTLTRGMLSTLDDELRDSTGKRS